MKRGYPQMNADEPVLTFRLILVIIGLLVMALGALGVQLGRLPGTSSFASRGSRLLPLATSIVVSLLLTLILWIVAAIARR
jgi:hypothetical protein